MKNIVSVVCFVFFVLLFSHESFSNDFRYIRTKEGLSDGEITSMVQDSTGNMWIGTYTGLTKYNGTKFEKYRPEIGKQYSLPDKKIKYLFVDSESNLWISTNRTLSTFNEAKNEFYTVDFERNNDVELNIWGITELKKHLIIHSSEGFYILPILKKGNKKFKAKRKACYLAGQVSSIFFRYSTNYSDKLLLVNEGNNLPSKIYDLDLNVEGKDTILELEYVTEVNGHVNAVEYVETQNTLYFATTNGLIPFSLTTNKLVKNTFFYGQDIRNAIYTSNHKIYCSLNRPELVYLDLHTGFMGKYEANPNESGTLLNSNILELFEDFSGNLWIGHQGQGISILNLFQKEFYTFRHNPLVSNTLNSNSIISFAESKDEYFIGCRSNGLNLIKKSDLLSKNPDFKSLKIPGTKDAVDDAIWDIQKESEFVYWLATAVGLYKLAKRNNKWEINPFEGQPAITELVWKLKIDENGNVWCGTFDGGLILIPDSKRNPENKYYRYINESGDSTSISDNYVKEIFLDSKNRFWIGTLNGLNKMEGSYDNLDLSGSTKPELRFKRYVAEKHDLNFLNNNEINSIIENFDGRIWISTNGGGINILEPETETFSHITTQNGLPSDDVYGMLPDEFGNIWLSTINGLVSYSQFDTSSVMRIFDEYDGIQGEVFMINSYYKAEDGCLFFGGDNGFTCFYANKIEINERKPKIAFSNFYFQGDLVNVGDTIRNGFILDSDLNYLNKIVLPPNRNYFKIEVATLHFQAPQKNKFSYKLGDYMNDWDTNLNTEKEIEFSNLPYGQYELMVKAISSDNVESADVKKLIIEIEPPWFRVWYMRALIMLFAFSAILGFIYILINRQRLIYQKKLNEITISNNESKMMFLTNIAHELRTPLSLVIAPIEDLMNNFAQENIRWKNHLQLIHRNSNYLLRLINQIIDFRKLYAGKLTLKLKKTDIVRVVKDVVHNFKGYESKRNIKMYLKVPAESVNVLIDVQKIEEVLYNLISNAFKNTRDGDSITISMNLSPNNSKSEKVNQIRITVFNEGKEISEEDQLKIFDRFYKIDDNIEGAGIGLSFSKSLVEMHSGIISVESIKNKGVAFHVDLSFDEIELVEDDSEEQVLDISMLPVNEEHSEVLPDTAEKTANKVLIIEDNVELREFLQQVLSRNYNCLIAENGKQGWEIVKSQIPSLIISDVIMPEMDGYELCRRVKEKRETCHIPVILLTAKNSNEQKSKGYNVGADAYVTKPFDINLLVSQSKLLIRNRELIREKYITQNFMVEVDTNISKDEEFVQTVKSLLEKNITDPEFNVNRLSEHLNISTTQLYRRLKALTGHSPVEFIRIIKLQKAYNLLSQRNKTVKEVCYLTGFNNLSYFIKCFKEQFGKTPANFRDNGKLKVKNDNTTNDAAITKFNQN